MNFCNIIDVRYALKVEACIDLGEWYYRMLQKNLKIRTTIFIGTMPLKNYEDTINEHVGTSNDLFRKYIGIHTHTHIYIFWLYSP
jgi:hypothetical protein